jgi:hypothetical protein
MSLPSLPLLSLPSLPRHVFRSIFRYQHGTESSLLPRIENAPFDLMSCAVCWCQTNRIVYQGHGHFCGYDPTTTSPTTTTHHFVLCSVCYNNNNIIIKEQQVPVLIYFFGCAFFIHNENNYNNNYVLTNNNKRQKITESQLNTCTGISLDLV